MGAGQGTGTLTGGTGAAGGNVGTGGAAAAYPPFEPPAASLRRLTRAQFKNALRDVFGLEVDTARLDQDSYTGSFAVVGASSVVTSQLGVERYHEVIEEVTDEVFSDAATRLSLVGCEPVTAGDACVNDFIQATGRRAYRRELAQTEVERLIGVAETAATELQEVWQGLKWATVAMFTSPHFLYRPELGSATGNPTRLTGAEVASRLAFLLWNSLPDDQLLDEAASGALDTSDGIRSAAERLLDAPRGKASIGAFADEYMRVDRVLTQAKDGNLFPEYGPALQQGMVRDMRRTWEMLALEEDADVLELFSTTKAFVNAPLAQLYGLDATGLDDATFAVRELPTTSGRVGILGKAAFLSQFANQKEGSPTLRGKFVREAIMCTEVPLPPPGVALELPESSTDAPTTKRQRLEEHRKSATCAGCHALMDPLGLPFESFDAIGRHRTLDGELPVDPSGAFDGVPVADAVELGHAMSASSTVADCVVEKYYSYSTGHELRDVDAIVVRELAEQFSASGHRFRELILDIVTNDAFVLVAPPSP